MFKNYFRASIRSLFKNKTYTGINILGLAIGLASFVVIIFYVSYERSFDKFLKNSDSIYRVYMDYLKEGRFEPGDAQAYNQSGPTLKKEFSEIKDYVRLFLLNKSTLAYDDYSIKVKYGYLADPTYFSIFSYPLKTGNPLTVLEQPNSIVLCDNISKKIFGNSDPIGKTITVYAKDKHTTLTVTGILEDLPTNTHLKVDYLISFQTINTWHVSLPWELNWNNNSYFTYILIDKNTNIANFKKKIGQLDFPNNEDERHNIEPLTSIHLHSNKPYEAEANGSATRVKFLFAIAIIIIVLSWLNYINLSTSKSMERLKEVGVRKVSGAKRKHLIFQFTSESLILNLAAVLLASIIVALSLPYLYAFTGKNLVTDLSWSIALLQVIGIPLLGIVVSGIYPAYLISGFKPSIVLKGKTTNTPHSGNMRQMFVIAQFSATIVLIIGSIVVMKQMKFLHNQPLGMSLNNIISIKGATIDEENNHQNKLNTLKEEIQKLNFVEKVSTASTYPGAGYDDIDTNMGITYPDGTKESQTAWYTYYIDENYIPLMGIKVIAGEQFTSTIDTSGYNVLLNEKAARVMGFTNMNKAVNQKFKIGDANLLIVGIVNNFHFFGLKEETRPFILLYRNFSNELLVKLKTGTNSLSDISNSTLQLKAKWEEIFPKSTFSYSFIDEEFGVFYKEEKMFSKVFMIFTFLAIIIASMGLFGLAYYRSLVRTKEIGIRKVNGARTLEVMTMLNRNFIKWVAIAFILACPIAWYAMHKWLENFAYKTALSWWVFAAAGIIAMALALLTVSWQSWRAATRNPVESLKYE